MYLALNAQVARCVQDDKALMVPIAIIILLNSQSCIVIVQQIPAIKMKLIGFLLLFSGWGIVLAALAMLHGAATSGFILAGLAVEILGLVLVAHAHLPVSEERG